MSKMAELDWDIEYRVCEGMSNEAIARDLDIPIKMVEDWHTSVGLEWEEAFPADAVLDLTKYPFINEDKEEKEMMYYGA
jgi:FixJ family two-component response regulator